MARQMDRRLPDMDRLRITDAAQVIGVDRMTLWRWIRAGKVPGAAKTPGGYWTVPLAWVEEVGRIRRTGGSHEGSRP
jgi:predicted site-specific integrase-resolvase